MSEYEPKNYHVLLIIIEGEAVAVMSSNAAIILHCLGYCFGAIVLIVC